MSVEMSIPVNEAYYDANNKQIFFENGVRVDIHSLFDKDDFVKSVSYDKETEQLRIEVYRRLYTSIGSIKVINTILKKNEYSQKDKNGNNKPEQKRRDIKEI